MRRKLKTIQKNIKIVKLQNDKYAIRKGWTRFKYFDLIHKKWVKLPFMDVCQHNDLQHIAEYYDFLFMDMGKPVELEREFTE